MSVYCSEVIVSNKIMTSKGSALETLKTASNIDFNKLDLLFKICPKFT